MAERRPNDTIYALSSGAPPAAVALVRISGPGADAALARLAPRPVPPRSPRLRVLRAGGVELDRALVIRFPGPNSATGEDVVELHLHGGRAVVAAVGGALRAAGLREAEPGEFTRRAFVHGRIDLSEAEGLADLLAAETESQRRAALEMAGGALSRRVEAWRTRLLAASAAVEAELDHADEGDVAASRLDLGDVAALRAEIGALLRQPPAERLRDGVRIVFAGPPNAGKSTLFNALAGREAAIVTPTAGTTRDLVEAPVALGGTPLLLVDTAGLRESADEVEAIGIGRARAAAESADLLVWLGPPDAAPAGNHVIPVQTKIDLSPNRIETGLSVSPVTGAGMSDLIDHLVARARALLPAEGEVALNRRQGLALAEIAAALEEAGNPDPLVVAEGLRRARAALDRLTGRAGVEAMLDALFSRFCIGK